MKKIVLVMLLLVFTTACNSINEFVVTYDSQGGTEYEQQTYLPRETINLPTPERDDYTFDGWYLEPTFETKVDESFTVEEDITIYAKWIGEFYTITFDTAGGNDVEPETIRKNTNLVLPTPSRSGYIFLGWTENLDTKEPFNETKMPMRDITLYAIWQLYTASTTYTIGYIGPLTGEGSDIANDILNGVILAIDEININGGINGAFLSLSYHDSENNSSVTVDAYTELLEDEDLVAIISGGDEGEVQLLTSYAESDNIAIIAPAVTDNLTDETEVVYQVALTEDQRLAMGIGYAIDLGGATHPAILYNSDSDYSFELYLKYRVILINQGVMFETYSIGVDDEEWQLESTINSFSFRGCDMWISPAAQGYFTEFMNMAINMGVDSPFVHLDSWNYDELEGNGRMLKEFSPYDTEEDVVAFTEMYQLQYSEIPGLHSALGYDSVKIIASAIENTVNVTSASILQSIKNVELTSSITGFIGFNEEGTAMKEIAIIEVIEGSPVVVERYREEQE